MSDAIFSADQIKPSAKGSCKPQSRRQPGRVRVSDGRASETRARRVGDETRLYTARA